MSLFRKLLGNQDGGGQKAPPSGLQTMGVQLQRKFARGVQYNMKIVIRGDRNVGKSCLFHRLQGHKFKEEYIPTEEIQVCNIQWNYKTTDDVVKVEIWDVVDKGKKKKKPEGLKMDNSVKDAPDEPCLDAEFMDVYKGSHGVILMYDITKQWTFTYVEREMEKVPAHIPVLVLGNHRDMGHHRTVTEDKARYYCQHYDRPEGSGEVRYAESSMCNGFGLRYLHKFFNLPYLQLQRESLLKQLEVNSEDFRSTVEELDIHEESEEQNYDVFIDNLSNKRRQQQDKFSGSATSESDLKQEVIIENSSASGVPKSLSMPALQQTTISNKSESKTPTNQESVPPVSSPEEKPAKQVKSPNQTPAKPTEPEQKTGFFSRLFKSKETHVEKKDVKEKIKEDDPVTNVDEFIPDGGAIDASFLDDSKDTKDSGKIKNVEESDSEDEGNPMVAGFQDDLDSDDNFIPTQVASDDSDSDHDNMQIQSKSNIQRKQSTESDVNHFNNTESNAKEIESEDSDHNIPVTKDESDIDDNPVTQVTVAADDSDIEENVNSQVLVTDDVSDIDENLDSHVTVAADQDISDDDTVDKDKEMNNVTENTTADQRLRSDSDLGQQPDFGDWLDTLESKNKKDAKTSHVSKDKIDVLGTDVIKKKKKKKRDKEEMVDDDKKKSKKKDKSKTKKEKKKKKKDSDEEDLETFLNDVPSQPSGDYDEL
ncbi:rab-like protein 6 [Mytilus californianus]|uniref:rab-like protein 6 n=1 Tax=Mytilus californianus TaxID=6549 RepID=UPI0022486DA2|nr:rab-like protein 6 [Mytilus californianus]